MWGVSWPLLGLVFLFSAFGFAQLKQLQSLRGSWGSLGLALAAFCTATMRGSSC